MVWPCDIISAQERRLGRRLFTLCSVKVSLFSKDISLKREILIVRLSQCWELKIRNKRISLINPEVPGDRYTTAFTTKVLESVDSVWGPFTRPIKSLFTCWVLYWKTEQVDSRSRGREFGRTKEWRLRYFPVDDVRDLGPPKSRLRLLRYNIYIHIYIYIYL